MEISQWIKADQKRVFGDTPPRPGKAISSIQASAFHLKKRMPISWVSLFLSVTLLVILSACGGSGGSGAQSTLRIQIFQGTYAQAFQQAAQGFEKSHPDVKVSIETLDDTTSRGPNITVMSSSDAPDIGFLQRSTGVYSALVKNNDLVNLDPLWQQSKLASLYGDQTSNYFTTNGHHYAVLLDGQYINPIFYNKQLFAQAHVNAPANHQFASMDQWYALTGALRKAGIQPLGVGGASPYDLGHDVDALFPTAVSTEQFKSYLADWQPGTPETVKYTDPGFAQVLQTLMNWKQRGVFEDGFQAFQVQQVQGEFAAGKVAMIQGGVYSPAVLQQAGVDPNNLGWFMSPPILPGATTPFDVYAGDSFVIPTHAQHQQLAKEFITYFLQPNVVNQWAAQCGTVSPYTGPLSSSILKQYPPLVQEMLLSLRRFGVVGIWDSEVPGQIGQKTEIPLVQAMLSGQSNVQETAQKFQAALDSVRSQPAAPLD